MNKYLEEQFKDYDYKVIHIFEDEITVQDMQEKHFEAYTKTVQEWIEDFEEQERYRQNVIGGSNL